MQKRLLLDGCSFTYGLGLQFNETIEHLFLECGYDILNLSRPGKSNHAIALDVYNNARDFDIIVVGWTYSSRWHLQYHKQNIDLLPTRLQVELPYTLDSNVIEQSYQELHRSLYSLFDSDYWSRVSDMLIDNAASHLVQQGKKIVFFSWESRNTICPMYLPHIRAAYRLPDGHLNATGTKYLFDNLTALIEP